MSSLTYPFNPSTLEVHPIYPFDKQSRYLKNPPLTRPMYTVNIPELPDQCARCMSLGHDCVANLVSGEIQCVPK